MIRQTQAYKFLNRQHSNSKIGKSLTHPLNCVDELQSKLLGKDSINKWAVMLTGVGHSLVGYQ